VLDRDCATGRRIMPQYPEYKVREEELGFYNTFQQAESGILRNIKNLKEQDSRHERDKYCKINDLLFYDIEYKEAVSSSYAETHSYAIEERKTNCEYFEAETRRSYLPDGTLLDACLTAESYAWNLSLKECSDDEKRRGGWFPGREAEEIRFKKGDIVEVLGSKSVCIGIVIGTPCLKNELNGDYRDASDDMYHVMFGENVYNYKPGGDTHAFNDGTCIAVYVFAPRFPVPERLKKILRFACLDWSWHPYIYQCLNNKDEKDTYMSYIEMAYGMKKERLDRLLIKMGIPFAACSDGCRVGENEFVDNKNLPRWVMNKIQHEENPELCAALCYGLSKYLEGIEWN
jgi:hypothetical protein